MIAKRQVHLLGSRSLNGALAKFDDERDGGDDDKQTKTKTQTEALRRRGRKT